MNEKAPSTSLVQRESSLNVSSYWHCSGLHVVTILNLTLSFFFRRGQFPPGKHCNRPFGGVGRDETRKLKDSKSRDQNLQNRVGETRVPEGWVGTQ